MRIYLSIGLCLALVAPAFGAIQKGSVEVAALKGSVSLLNLKGKRAPLTRGLSFQEGNSVETLEKSTTELALSNGSTLSVEPNTLMTVKTFSQVTSPLIVPGKYQELSAEPSPSVVQIEVYRGKIQGEVRKLNPNTQYTIKTPVGYVRVRGTIFSVEYTEDRSGHGHMKVTCTSGSVSIRTNSNNGSTVIGPGEDNEVVGTPDNVITTPNKPADINNDGIPDVMLDDNGDGKADGIDVNGDGKPDKLVSSRPDGRLDGVDLDGDGKADAPIVDSEGNPSIAIVDENGVPRGIVTVEQIEREGGYVLTPLTYPEATDPNGNPIKLAPTEGNLPPPPPPAPPAPPSKDITTDIIQKETQEPVSPSGG